MATHAKDGFDPLAAYRAMFAGPENGMSAWWYFGEAFAEMDGFPSIPVIQAETLMIYKTQPLSPDAFRMDWWEIGYMRDLATGEIAKSWLNPITGARMPAPSKFEEGPAHFLISRDGDGLKLELTQAHARIERVDVTFTRHGDRLQLTQVEQKVRGFPLPDGTMPSLDSPNVSRARTQLTLFSGIADLGQALPPSSGVYDFELSSLPSWMGFGALKGRFLTRGAMVKAPDIHHQLNPIAWARLKSLFPERFDRDRVAPKWS